MDLMTSRHSTVVLTEVAIPEHALVTWILNVND